MTLKPTVVASVEKVTTPSGVLLSMSNFTKRAAAALALASIQAYKIYGEFIPW